VNKVTQEKKALIAKAYANFTDRRILVFSSIKGEAFETFKEILVKRNAPFELEEFILYRDLTILGGGEEGILITNAHFYYYQWGYQQIAISDIAEIKYSGWFDEYIIFVLKNGKSVSMAIWASSLFDEIREVIEILQTDDNDDVTNVDNQSAPLQVRCLGCRAIVRANQKVCEYCRSPLS